MMSKKKKTIIFCMWLLTFIFVTIETAYFGWNLFPMSKAEWVCDITPFFILVSGVIIVKNYHSNSN